MNATPNPNRNATVAVKVESLSHNYGKFQALKNIAFSVRKGEIFGLLGPNGGGKTTTFRLLSTLIRPSVKANVTMAGFDLLREAHEIRRRIGVVFQAPSLDKKLTAYENLMHQGHLYGLSGASLKARIFHVLERVKLADQANEYVETFSGGMRRRVELAKGMLHKPEILLLDEPSTGLDPGARRDLWNYLEELSRDEKITSLLTTHYMEEASQCHRIAILNKGELVALDTPDNLRSSIGGDVITLNTREPEKLCQDIKEKLKLEPTVIDGKIRIERENGNELIVQIIQTFPDRIDSITLSKPTLDDVFLRRTGHQFWTENLKDS